MKNAVSLLTLFTVLVSPEAVLGSAPLIPRHLGLNLSPFGLSKAPHLKTSNFASTYDLHAVVVRGGSQGGEAAGPSSYLTLEFASSALIQVFGALNAFHGLILAFIPAIGQSLLGSKGDEIDDDAAAYAEEAVGVFALEYGVTGYLAATGRTSPEKAIGYGTLLDLYFLAKNLVNGNFAEFGVQKLMSIMTVIAAGGTGAILGDKLHLGPVIEMMTVVPAVVGSMKYFDPVGSAKKMLGTDLEERPVAKALYRHSGQMKLVSAVLRGAIAFGAKPLKALGYSSLFDAVLIADSVIIRKTADDVGNNRALAHQIFSFGLSVTMGAVFLMAGE